MAKQNNVQKIAGQNKPVEIIKDRPNRVNDQIFVAAALARGRQLIDDWQKALRAAESTSDPNREQLYKLYHNLLIDADLHSEWDTKRKLRFLGGNFNLVDQEGNVNPEATKMLQKKWFLDLLNHALDSKLMGHSLVEVHKINDQGLIAQVKLVNRRHVIPEKGLFVPKIGDKKGIFYRQDPNLYRWMFEFGEDTDLGILAKCAPYILFMRFALSAWSEYAEKFAMPIRVGKTNTVDNTSLNRMDAMLLEMATASYAIIDKDEELELIESSRTDGSNVFDKLIGKCEAKLAKIMNGSVTGDASQGGSRAKEQVGQDIQYLVTNSDFTWFESIMNDSIIPQLIGLGYPFAGLTFEYEKPKDTDSLLKIVTELAKHYKIPNDWITENFGVPVEDLPTPEAAPVIRPTAKGGDHGFF